ncbi:unnamed protein product [Penicillium roqueforti FM164]|uniref:Genomic scaffold, ProqFM164S02 n=1 Tax=Penicillium roqueforti (strain FM164) TaxID=1365484 RepID=W6QST7_PENRF|nr:unnamed protein product [Penicillium roqueforti FM164]
MIWQPRCSWRYASNQLVARASCGYARPSDHGSQTQWTYMANWHRYFRSPSRGIHGLTNLLHEDNESAENFHRVAGQFIHGNSGHTSQVLQPPVDQSTGSVATGVLTSVGTSLASSGASTLPPIVIKAESQDLAL